MSDAERLAAIRADVDRVLANKRRYIEATVYSAIETGWLLSLLEARDEAIASALTSLGTGPLKDGYAAHVLSEASASHSPVQATKDYARGLPPYVAEAADDVIRAAREHCAAWHTGQRTHVTAVRLAEALETLDALRSPVQDEAYPDGWLHATVHINPATGELHTDGDHSVREFFRVECSPVQEQRCPMGQTPPNCCRDYEQCAGYAAAGTDAVPPPSPDVREIAAELRADAADLSVGGTTHTPPSPDADAELIREALETWPPDDRPLADWRAPARKALARLVAEHVMLREIQPVIVQFGPCFVGAVQFERNRAEAAEARLGDLKDALRTLRKFAREVDVQAALIQGGCDVDAVLAVEDDGQNSSDTTAGAPS